MFFKIFTIFYFLMFSLTFGKNLDISELSLITEKEVKDVIKTFALGGDYKAIHYATPEGIAIGLDAGIEVTAIKLDDNFKAAFLSMGNDTDDIPGYIPVPRINITKGLPLGFDLGFSILKIKISGIDILNWGGSIKYALLQGNAILPSIALRGTFNRGEYFDIIETTTYGFEALVSKNFLFIEPFAGVGYQKGKGKFDISSFIPSELPVDYETMNFKPSVSQARIFAGTTLKLGFFHIALQGDFGKVKTYSTKLSLNF